MNKENNKKDAAGMVDNWLNEILDRLDIEQPDNQQIGADENAIASAGLKHPDDMELERIVQESLAEDFSDAFAADKSNTANAQDTQTPQEEEDEEDDNPSTRPSSESCAPREKRVPVCLESPI